MFEISPERKARILHFVPHIIRHDFWRKFAAVVFAAIVTSFVYSRVETVEVMDIQGVKVNLSLKDNLVYQSLTEPEYFVSLTVEGDSRLLSKLTASDFRIRKDVFLAEYEKNSSIQILPSDVKCIKPGSGSLKILFVTPASIPLNLDRVIVRDDVPLRAIYSAEDLPPDYKVSVRFSPDQDSVRVTGRSRTLNSMQFVQTEKFKVSKTATNSYSFDVRLERQPNVFYSFDTVKVFVDITGPAPREFTNVPIQILVNPAMMKESYAISLNPRDVSVRVKANSSMGYDLLAEEIHPYIDISGITEPGKYTVSVKCWSDRNNIEILDVRPETVSVTFLPEDSREESASGK